MKSLLHGCAAIALLAGLAGQAHAQVEVREAPVHSVPSEADGGAPPAMTMAPPAEAPQASADNAAPPRAEPQVVKALTPPKAPPPAPALSPEENAFFAVLGHRVTDAASAYESYVRRATAIDARFGDAAAVQKAVKTGAAYQPQQLQEGIVAYAALLALRNQDFVDGVRAVRDPSFADRLSRSPQAVLDVRGADLAAADVAGALRAQGAALTAAGKQIGMAAYDVQAQSWSKTPVADPQGVLAGVKAEAAQPVAASVPAKQRLLDSLVAPQLQPASNTVTASGPPDVVRGLALAAMAIMGKTGDDNEAAFEALLHDATSADCLKMAKMNLNQCLAVAGPQYEDVYCTGRHGVGETASCVSGAANAAGTALPAALPPQRAEGYGPEQARAYGQPGLRPQDANDDDSVPDAPPQRYASVQPSYAPPPLAAPPVRQQPAPPAYQDSRQTYADNAYAPAPYQDPRGYAQPQPLPQPQPQYPPQAYADQGYQQPQYPQPAPAYQQPAYQAPQQQSYQGQAYQPYPYAAPSQNYYGR